MELEFSPDEINQVVRAARVVAPGFSIERLKWLVNCQERLTDSGFCDAANGLAQLEKERGETCLSALDALKRLLQEKTELESNTVQAHQAFEKQKAANREAEEKHRQLVESIEQAKKQLVEIKAERIKEETQLVALRVKAEDEKKRLDREVEEYQQKVNVEKQEIDAAAKLKVQVESSGFSLELMLALSKEFAGYQDARGKLAGALKQNRKLTEYLVALSNWAEERKTSLESDIAVLESQRNTRQLEVRKFEETRRSLQSAIAELQKDAAMEQELRNFYWQYKKVSRFIEYLAKWEHIFFFRCDSTLSAMAGVFDKDAVAHFWTDRPAIKCPHCGLPTFTLDKEVYDGLGEYPGAPIKITLGG